MGFKLRRVLGLGMVLGMCMTFTPFTGVYGQTETPLKPATEIPVHEILESCYQCHGAGGISTLSSRPNLAGQNATYLRNQLWAFTQAGERGNKVMRHVGAGLDRKWIAPLAQHLSKLSCRADTPELKPLPAPPVAEPCARCHSSHGSQGISQRSDIPNLAGQQRSYLRRQMIMIRESAWGGSTLKNEDTRRHPILEQQTARLNIQDVDRLAKYYASLDCRGTP